MSIDWSKMQHCEKHDTWTMSGCGQCKFVADTDSLRAEVTRLTQELARSKNEAEELIPIALEAASLKAQVSDLQAKLEDALVERDNWMAAHETSERQLRGDGSTEDEVAEITQLLESSRCRVVQLEAGLKEAFDAIGCGSNRGVFWREDVREKIEQLLASSPSDELAGALKAAGEGES